MKTNKYIFAAAAAFAAISCAKDNTAVVETAEKHIVRTTIEVTTDALTKADFNLNKDETAYQVSWENGDKVVVLQKRYPTTDHENAMNEFSYNGINFEGSIINPHAGSKWNAFFPCSQFSNFSSSSNTVKANLPNNQNGTKASFNSCYLMYRMNKSAEEETPSGQAEGADLTDVKLSFDLKGLSSIIKINVPSSLNLKTITLTAKDGSGNDVPIAGNITLQTAKGDAGLLNKGSGQIRKGDKNTIVVNAGEGTFSGEVYIYLLPDNYTSEYYYSTAAKLNFSFTNADGAVCDKVVDINPEHPLRGGVLHNFGSLPEVLPFPFDFSLIMNPSNNFKVKPAEYPNGTTFTYDYPGVEDATEAPAPTDNMYFTVTGTYNGATKTINAYYRVWSLVKESDFESDASQAGITSGTATTSEICFTSNDLVCTCPTGGKITFNNTTYTTFNGAKVNGVNTPISLCFNAIHDGMLSIGAAAASNGTANRTCYLYLNDDNIIVDETNECFIYTTNGGTGDYEFVKQVCDYMDVKANDRIKITPAWNGQRFKKIYLLQWGENVKAETKSVTSESLSGTHNYDI